MRITAGVILTLAGTVWILQGFNVAFAPQSFMTANGFWVGAGAATAGVGIALIWWGLRDSRTKRGRQSTDRY